MKTYIIIVYASQIALYSNCELYTYARATAAPRCERVDCNRAIRKPYFFIFHPKVSFRRRQSPRERIITPPKMLIMFMRVHFFRFSILSFCLLAGRHKDFYDCTTVQVSRIVFVIPIYLHLGSFDYYP